MENSKTIILKSAWSLTRGLLLQDVPTIKALRKFGALDKSQVTYGSWWSLTRGGCTKIIRGRYIACSVYIFSDNSEIFLVCHQVAKKKPISLRFCSFKFMCSNLCHDWSYHITSPTEHCENPTRTYLLTQQG